MAGTVPTACQNPSELSLGLMWPALSLFLLDPTEYQTLPAGTMTPVAPSRIPVPPTSQPYSPLDGSGPRTQGTAWISLSPLNAEISVLPLAWSTPGVGKDPLAFILHQFYFILLLKTGGGGKLEVVI